MSTSASSSGPSSGQTSSSSPANTISSTTIAKPGEVVTITTATVITTASNPDGTTTTTTTTTTTNNTTPADKKKKKNKENKKRKEKKKNKKKQKIEPRLPQEIINKMLYHVVESLEFPAKQRIYTGDQPYPLQVTHPLRDLLTVSKHWKADIEKCIAERFPNGRFIIAVTQCARRATAISTNIPIVTAIAAHWPYRAAELVSRGVQRGGRVWAHWRGSNMRWG